MKSVRLNGAVITELRLKPGASYEALASDIGVSPSVVRQMENGYVPRRRREEILKRLAEIRGCSVGALLLPEAKRRTA